MIVDTHDYKITRNDVPVLTRTDDGNYVNTNCLLNKFYIESENLKDILSGFGYKENILTAIKQYEWSPVFTPVLRILTNTNIQTPNFDIAQDALAVALFLDKGKNEPTCLSYFEVNRNYRRNTTKDQKHKNVGHSMLQSLQQQYINQGIEGRSTYEALNFYYKYGFKRIDDRELHLRWQPQR